MVLIGVADEGNGWIASQWRLTYPASWSQILKAAHAMLPYLERLQVLADDALVPVADPRAISAMPEAGKLTVRGGAAIVGVPVSVTFYNQLQNVEVLAPRDTPGLEGCDYRGCCMALCQYMDSVEIAMHA